MVVALALVGTLAAGGCGGAAREEAAPAFTGVPLELQDPGAVHVHGLGYDRGRKVLYIATHTGMFELTQDATTAARIGDSHQDTMGFTLVKPDLFLGSGHPDPREELPAQLGLIKSTDRGRTWEPVSFFGEADFHVLRARGSAIYGFDATSERLFASTDGGVTWAARTTPEALLDLAIDPGDANHLLGSGGAVLYRSVDGARSWEPVAGGASGSLAWPSKRRLFVATRDGAFSTATAPQGPWESLAGLGATPAALHAVDPKHVFAALHDGTIKESRDGGVTWEVRARP